MTRRTWRHVQHDGGRKSRVAFTLAEVLITLTIIGVIAALTIPNLMHKWQQKELETGFKKAYALASQTLQLMQQEVGNDNIWEYYQNVTDINDAFFSHLKIEKSYNHINNYSKNYTKTNSGGEYYTFCYWGCKILNNGMIIDNITSRDGNVIQFMIDTNGKKGPNAMGHDIIYFSIFKSSGKLGTWYGSDHCGLSGNSSINGMGCLPFALKNICPTDSTKTYWECLP